MCVDTKKLAYLFIIGNPRVLQLKYKIPYFSKRILSFILFYLEQGKVLEKEGRDTEAKQN